MIHFSTPIAATGNVSLPPGGGITVPDRFRCATYHVKRSLDLRAAPVGPRCLSSLLRHLNHDLAHRLAVGEILLRLGQLCEREDLVEHGAQLLALEEQQRPIQLGPGPHQASQDLNLSDEKK